ncbi:MAG: hypothetical protein LKF74_05785 [Megasphaera sp.]|jgi:hypothetical protein|nr:hypothetical protein [Megasphaera sp.]MCH4188259.1 hypothetical protein [Megasphaera sp.]MCH4218051.1 hypothetical protein [Megasphaera sp.]
MKKIGLFLALLFCLMTSTVLAADNPRFDGMRTVLVVNTTQQGYPAQYMKKRLAEPFRVPYWDRVEASSSLSPDNITVDTLRQLSTQYNADIVVVPLVRTWYWREYTAFFWYDDGEMFTECTYDLAVYAYNRQDDSLKSYSSRGSKREETSILNNPDDILYPAMNQILEKLPYKRIPTDREDIADQSAANVLQTRTTAGGAKIITNTSPMAI